MCSTVPKLASGSPCDVRSTLLVLPKDFAPNLTLLRSSEESQTKRSEESVKKIA